MKFFKDTKTLVQVSFAVNFAFLALLSSPVFACGPGRGGSRRVHKYRKLVPLVVGQYHPNVHEHNLAASGRSEKPVTKVDRRFKDLVENKNPDIEFRAGASRLMTQRTKEKLNTLAISVMNYWPEVKLRVLDGWNDVSKMSHPPNSLHYEGRAIDIATNDKDYAKNGMLARLAAESGFDWVHYESRKFVHCSVKSDSVVQTQQGPTNISQIQPNQKVLCMDQQTGSLKYSPFLMWLDVNHKKKQTFIEIKTNSTNSTLTLTPAHLIYVSESPNYFETYVNYAKNLFPGQFVPVNDQLSSQAQMDQIISVEYITKQGFYAPLTREGNIVVNSVVASCYAVISDHDLAHIPFAPYRWFSYINEWIFGNTTLPQNPYYHSKQRYDDNSNISQVSPSSSSKYYHYLEPKIHWYPKMLHWFGRHLLPPSYFMYN